MELDLKEWPSFGSSSFSGSGYLSLAGRQLPIDPNPIFLLFTSNLTRNNIEEGEYLGVLLLLVL